MNAIGPTSEIPHPLDLYVGPDYLAATPNFTIAPAINRVYGMSFQTHRRRIVSSGAYWVNVTVAGNVCLAILDENLNRLATTGSVPIGPSGSKQTINLVAPVTLLPGTRYYAAFETDTGGTFRPGIVYASGYLYLLSDTIAFQKDVGVFPIPAAIAAPAAAGILLQMVFI